MWRWKREEERGKEEGGTGRERRGRRRGRWRSRWGGRGEDGGYEEERAEEMGVNRKRVKEEMEGGRGKEGERE